MWMTIDKASGITLTRQIYNGIRKLLADGILLSGDKLPSTRTLSKELGVSRNIVLDVYSQMIAEGYLASRHGSGTKVAPGLKEFKIAPDKTGERQEIPVQKSSYDGIDFCSGIPALHLFPRKKWARVYQRTCGKLTNAAFSYCNPSGIGELREAIAQYLFRSRGLLCDPGQIMVTSGATQGLYLIARLLQENNKKVIVENPTHPGLRKVMTREGCSIMGLPADARGLDTELLDGIDNVSFIYTTPSHQYPLGGILPIQRRLALIRYAEKNNCYIIEDDYDSEFRYEGPPVSALYEMNPERVIYIGSFSKIFAPAIRMGFMILPDTLMPGCKEIKTYSDVHTDALTQYALAEFIQTGCLEKHLWKMKKYYGRNRSHLLQELNARFEARCQIVGQSTGLHLVARFDHVDFSRQMAQEIETHGVRVYPVEAYMSPRNGRHIHEILLGYSHLSPSEITEGIRILSCFIS